MKVYNLILVSMLSLFLSACGSEVDTGIVEDDPIKTAQYIGEVYGENISGDDIEFIDTDYGEVVGIVPTFKLNGDESSGVVRLNKDDEVEAVFLRNISDEQVRRVLYDIGIEENVGFDSTIENSQNPYNEGHKTKYNEMELDLISNFAFFSQLEAPSSVQDLILEDLDLEAFQLSVQFNQE